MRTTLPYRSKKNSLVLIIVGICLTLSALLIAIFQFETLGNIENRISDNVISLIPLKSVSKEIIIVDIDDISLDAVGQWPWPRYRIAFLLDKIMESTPKVIGVDILFAEKDRTSLDNILKSFKHEFNLDIQFENIPPDMGDNDGYLAKVISDKPVILSNYFLFDAKKEDSMCSLKPVEIITQQMDINILEAYGILCNIPVLSYAAGRTGFINNYLDTDGILRRLPLLLGYKNQKYTNLSVAMVMEYLGVDKLNITSDLHGQYLNIDSHNVPIDKNGYALLNFRGRGRSFQYISAVDVLNNNYNKSDFNNKIVLVGATAKGLNDFFQVSIDPYYPGVEVHATLIDNLLDDDLYQIPYWNNFLQYFLIIFCGVLMSFVAAYRQAKIIVWVAIGLSIFIISILFVCLWSKFVVMVLIPLALVFIIFMVLNFMNYRLQEKQAVTWIQTILDAQRTTIISMAAVAESRDPETGEHLQRTQLYIKLLAEALVARNVYTDQLDPEFIELLWESAPLHDIGKVGIPDHILLKPAGLTEDEFTEMKKHAEYGRDIIASTRSRSDDCGYLEVGEEIAYGHHERWNGEGYPQGLKGEDIPLSARLMAVADVYDALISKRVYKPPFSYEFAENRILEISGTHFDPAIIDVFREIKDRFREIGEMYKDK